MSKRRVNAFLVGKTEEEKHQSFEASIISSEENKNEKKTSPTKVKRNKVPFSFYLADQQIEKLDDYAYNLKKNLKKRGLDRQAVIRKMIEKCTFEQLLKWFSEEQ